MADDDKTEEPVLLKLLVDTETNKVVFAEAGKDFVDVLCSFLTLPLGTIARLIQKDSNIGPVKVGCLNSLYQSVSDLSKRYFLTKTHKKMLLQPTNSSEDYCNSLRLNIDDTPPATYFLCTIPDDSCCGNGLYTSSDNNCAGGNPLTHSVFLKHFHKGFVTSSASFVITDDLNVMPNSKHITSFGLLQNCGIKTTSSLKEMTFEVNKEKVLDLLKCALISKSPLTDNFLRKEPSLEESSRILNCDVENNANIQISVKVVIRKSDGKVLYAQGDEDFIDLLLTFLTFPLGGVVTKIENCSLGSIDKLYKSIVDLDEIKYFKSTKAKERLVDPQVASQFKLSNKILPLQQDMEYYCYYQGNSFKESIINNQFFISDEYRKDEKNCKNMFLLDNFKAWRGSREGYVKELKMYVVTDDLIVTHSSPISSLNLIESSETSLDDLKEEVVTIGLKEVRFPKTYGFLSSTFYASKVGLLGDYLAFAVLFYVTILLQCLIILLAALTSTSALTNGLAHLLIREEK
ncbi:uncharacterized protein LOC131637461 [Vicia villosa]|uniref:uncharacterized protein LOC131637461 n=1 Tax=Vicia villosa TaxID=3911 RepID=UPI00273CF144|nr:uncharacterized protein LOC131637461 [Vicia villosa]